MLSRVLSLVLAAAALAALAAAPALAQTNPAVAAKGYKAPRNAWGQPDLSGVWSPATITRLERDPKLGDRLVLTEAETEASEGETAQFGAQDKAPTDPNAKVTDLACGVKGFPAGPECGYNNFWVDPGTKVLRVAGEPRASILVSPRDGRLPMQPGAMARIAAQGGNARIGNFDGPERRPLGERCLIGFGSTAGPPMLPVLYNNHYAIAQTPTEVAIEVEMVHDMRLIRLGPNRPAPGVRQWMGASAARWEGETLVVETTGFRPDQTFRGASPDMRVTERFTRIAPTQLLYQFEVVDPTTFSSPVVGELAWTLTKDQIYEYACHEGNYALPGILAGARAEERKGREMEGARGQVKDEGED